MTFVTTGAGGTGGIGRPFARTPKLRVTVLRSSATDSVVYDGGFQFIGVGQRAIYGVLTTRPSGTTAAARTLIAIVTTQPLPATASRFASLSITGSPEVRMVAPDAISLVDGPVNVVPGLAIATRIRTATVLMRMPIIDSMFRSEAERPDTVAPKTTSPSPV